MSKPILSSRRVLLQSKTIQGNPEPSSPHGYPAGGFKLWECALDLSAHLCQVFDIRATQEQWSSALPGGTRVLELGCGHGLPGILLTLAGCKVHFQAIASAVLSSCVTVRQRAVLPQLSSVMQIPMPSSSSPGTDTAWFNLQDYNAEVLQSLTALNVLRNLESHPGIADLQDERPRYFAGMTPGVSYMLIVLPSWPVRCPAENDGWQILYTFSGSGR